jgi:hypothetical protein
VRGEDDTSGIAFAIGDKVQLRLPKVILEEFRDDITTNASDLTDYETSNDIALAASNARLTEIELYQVLAAPTGITLYIYNPAGEIPTGWSAKSGPADCLLAIAGGSDAYDVAGENTAGSWTPTGHVHTGPSHIHTMPTHYHTIAHTHTTGSLALTLAQMPPHTHVYYRSSGNMNHSSGSGALYQEYATNSGAAGSGAIHNHGTTSGASGGNSGSTDPGDTAGSGTANTGSSKEPSTDRPFAAVGILIERD